MLHSIYTYTRFLATILLTGIVFSTQAQILNDTSKQLYGYHSIRYGTEEDVFLNKGLSQEVDSSLASIQRYGYIYNVKNHQYSQDLGNWATPLKCVTSYVPSQLGVQTGFDVYNPYEFNANNIKYFDTRSPYAELKYYQGSRGQQSLDVSFTRNVNAQWNMGIDLRRIVSKRIIGYVTRNEKQAENYAFDFFVSHHSKNNKYFMLASFNYLEAHNFENGGIRADSVTDLNGNKRLAEKDDLFNNQLAQVWLTNTRSLDKRYNYRVYQHYNLLNDDRLQLFYRFDYSRRTNRYDDNTLSINKPFYSNYFSAYTAKGVYDTLAINDRTDFNLFDNRAGLKGNSGRFFYAAYIKQRYVTMRQASYSDDVAAYNKYTTEWYLDGQLRRYFDEEKKSYVEAIAEMQQAVAKEKRNYMASLRYIYKGIILEGSQWSVSPTLLQSQYRSNLVSWDRTFQLQKTNRLFVQYAFKTKRVDLIPSLAVNTYKDYIYFTQAGTPAQDSGKSITHIQPKLALRFNLWKIHVYNEFQYNNLSNGSNVLQMPSIVNATQLFVEAWLFKRATLLQVGFDVLYRNAYQANGYNPLIQQYYVTQYTGTGSRSFNYIDQATVVDFFVNMQIRTARLFVKVSNIKGIFTPDKGYFSTPYYSGIPYTIDFGVSWRFFD